MDIDFRLLITDLKALIERLKRRCLKAETRVDELQQLVKQQQERIAQLEAEKTDLDTKYRNLQLGMTATGNNPEQVNQLKEKYLAMVSEIDACIATLQHG